MASHPPTVGSLNCSYGAVPTLEFLYTSCFGVLSYICTYRGGIWGDSLGGRGAAARLGLGTVVLGVGTEAVGPPHPDRALPHGRAVTCGSPWGQVKVG